MVKGQQYRSQVAPSAPALCTSVVQKLLFPHLELSSSHFYRCLISGPAAVFNSAFYPCNRIPFPSCRGAVPISIDCFPFSPNIHMIELVGLGQRAHHTATRMSSIMKSSFYFSVELQQQLLEHVSCTPLIARRYSIDFRVAKEL